MTTQTCPRCQTPLPAGTSGAQCPRCLLRLGLDTGFAASQGAPAERRPPPSPAELAPDFPQLEILELLGQGGMGAVYRARQRSLDRLVALKVLTVDSTNDPDFATRFAREARALAALDHPNIVRVHDSGEIGGRYYLVMEHVDGTDLRHMLRAGRIAPREGLAIVAQVCDALQYAHDQGIVHRDIKPENLLVDRRGRVKIADFGLAKLVGKAGDAFALTGTNQAMGTPHYMAPEQIEHPQDVDHRADIYSLGVVLYELLTGELPLGRFVPPSRKVEIDVRLDEVVLKALEKDPPRRYQHASEVKSSIDGIASGASAPPAPTPPAQASPRARWPLVLGCAAVLLVTVPLVVMLLIALFMGARTISPTAPDSPPPIPTTVTEQTPFTEPIHGTLCREIDAAREIRARAPRLTELDLLATRPGLSAHEQLHLAEALLEGGFFEENAAGLVALIEHQELAPEAAALIRREVGGEDPGADKERVLQALEREKVPEKP